MLIARLPVPLIVESQGQGPLAIASRRGRVVVGLVDDAEPHHWHRCRLLTEILLEHLDLGSQPRRFADHAIEHQVDSLEGRSCRREGDRYLPGNPPADLDDDQEVKLANQGATNRPDPCPACQSVRWLSA